jgi:hypothetical protein
LEATIEQFILNALKKEKSSTIEHLAQIVCYEFSISKEEAIAYIVNLNDRERLTLKEDQVSSVNLGSLFSAGMLWYWSTVTLAIVTCITVFTIPENEYPFTFVRQLLGSIFVLFLPGFCLIKALYPQKEMELVERGALSVIASLTILPIVSFLLNCTSWGITITPLTIILLVLTLVFASVAFLRERQM